LSFGHSYGSLSKTGCDSLGSEVRAALSLLRFKISKPSDRFAGPIDTDILRCAVRVADESCYAAGVEDAIKITTGGLGSIGELVAGSLDLCASVVRLLQPFCSFVRLFEQDGVSLCPSGDLGDKAKQNLAGVNGRVSEAQLQTSARTGALEATCGLAPPWKRHTVPPGIALFLHCFPVWAVALHWTAGTLMGCQPVHRL